MKKIIGLFILVILLVLTLYFTLPISYKIIKLNSEICHELFDLGYEEYQDIATHKECRLTNDVNYGYKSFYKVYDDECRLNKPRLQEYGLNCIWGSREYIRLVFIVGGHFILIGIFGIIIASFLGYGKGKTEEEKYILLKQAVGGKE